MSYAVLETVAMGLMGIEPDAATRSVTTVSRLTPVTRWAEMKDVPLFDGTISVRHDGTAASTLTNNTAGDIAWHAQSTTGKAHHAVVRPGETCAGTHKT